MNVHLCDHKIDPCHAFNSNVTRQAPSKVPRERMSHDVQLFEHRVRLLLIVALLARLQFVPPRRVDDPLEVVEVAMKVSTAGRCQDRGENGLEAAQQLPGVPTRDENVFVWK